MLGTYRGVPRSWCPNSPSTRCSAKIAAMGFPRSAPCVNLLTKFHQFWGILRFDCAPMRLKATYLLLPGEG
jgi:hypothetical protein